MPARVEKLDSEFVKESAGIQTHGLILAQHIQVPHIDMAAAQEENEKLVQSLLMQNELLREQLHEKEQEVQEYKLKLESVHHSNNHLIDDAHKSKVFLSVFIHCYRRRDQAVTEAKG